jgi:hypothetical protein
MAIKIEFSIIPDSAINSPIQLRDSGTPILQQVIRK